MAESSLFKWSPKMALLASLMPPLMGCKLVADSLVCIFPFAVLQYV